MKLSSIGFVGSILWVGGTVCVFGDRFNQLNTMDLNECGDFLAGFIAPLAFYWLIIGYFQQREELKQNTMALKLQQKELRFQVLELKNSVEQQTRSADAQTDLIKIEKEKHEIAKHPLLIFRSFGGPNIEYKLSNERGKVYHFSFEDFKDINGNVTSIELKGNYGRELDYGHEVVFIGLSKEIDYPISFRMKYKTIDMKIYFMDYQIDEFKGLSPLTNPKKYDE